MNRTGADGTRISKKDFWQKKPASPGPKNKMNYDKSR